MNLKINIIGIIISITYKYYDIIITTPITPITFYTYVYTYMLYTNIF